VYDAVTVGVGVKDNAAMIRTASAVSATAVNVAGMSLVGEGVCVGVSEGVNVTVGVDEGVCVGVSVGVKVNVGVEDGVNVGV